MIWVIIVLLLGIALLSLNKCIIKDNYRLVNPVNIYILLWMFTCGIHYCVYGYAGYMSDAYLGVVISMIFFAIGFWVLANKKIHFKKNALEIVCFNLKGIKSILIILTILDVIRVINAVMIIYHITNGNLSLLVTRGTYVRNLYLNRTNTALTAIISVFTSINALVGFSLLGIYCSKKGEKYVRLLVIWTILEIAISFLTMSKLVFLIYILFVGTSYFYNIGGIKVQRQKMRKIIPWVLALILLLLYLIAVERNYAAQGDSLIRTLYDKVLFYFVSPLEGLGLTIDTYKCDYGGLANTMYVYAKFFLRLLNVEVTNHMDAIRTSLGYTNVYTWLYPFYQDMSYIGFAFFPFVIGIIAGLFYGNFEYSILRTLINADIICILSMSFYFYLWGQGSYTYVLLYGIIIEKTLARKLYFFSGE